MGKIIDICPEHHNLAVYFILPLAGLNKNGFGSNFVNAYLSHNGKAVVRIQDKELNSAYQQLHNYLTDFDDEDGSTLIVFSIPDKFAKDVVRFMDGRYSKMSKTAQELIKNGCGLPYQVAIPDKPGFTQSHKMILALERNPNLKVWIEDKIGEVLADDAELLDPPSADELLDIQLETVVD